MRRNIPISLPSLGEEEWLATKDSFDTGWLTQGPKVAAFERRFAEKHGVKHAFAVTSCTTGLHLALVALGIGPGDEVLVPAFTWIATANVVRYCNAIPVFVDVDPNTYNIDPAQIKKHLTEKTKAIIPVHLFGLCANLEAIKEVLPESVKIVEDAACAAGAAYRNTPAGGLGDLGVFSFHPRKMITTGEGGMVTTNDDTLAELVNQLRNHGASISEEQRHQGPRPYLLPEFDLLGFNYRMTDLQGAVGLVQIEKLETFLKERKEAAAYYTQRLEGLDWLKTPSYPSECTHSWQAYVCAVDPENAPFPRNVIMDQLQKKGISTRPGTHAVHNQRVYKKNLGWVDDPCPIATWCQEQTIALPLHNKMTYDDYDYVIEELHLLSKEFVLT